MTSGSMPASIQGISIASYTLEALRRRGVRHIFGVPGDFTLSFCSAIEKSDIQFIVCRNELNSAYAAEGYARAAGLGVVTATYDVGAFSALNGIALANAENTPLVMITGSPGMAERVNDPELHHKSGPFNNQAETFRLHTVASTVITNPVTAFSEIDRVLNEVTLHKRPGFIEIPRDMVDVVPATDYTPQTNRTHTDKQTLNAVVEESRKRLASARRPIIIAGLEIHRFNLQAQLLDLLDATGIPLTATLLSKSVIDETHPLFMGIYAGHLGDPEVAKYVEESDCLLFAGVIMSDIDVGKAPLFNHEFGIFARNGHFQFGDRHYFGVQLADYLPALADAVKGMKRSEKFPRQSPIANGKASPDEPVTVRHLISALDSKLDKETLVVCDIGDALFSALELRMPRSGSFFANSYYASMGHSIPAAVGAHFANPALRKVVLCGDGAFQMTFQELSTAVIHKMPMVVILFDNHGYETERRLFPGKWQFNSIPEWDYARVADLFKGGKGYTVSSASEFDSALDEAWNSKGVSLIHARLITGDASPILKRLSDELKVP